MTPTPSPDSETTYGLIHASMHGYFVRVWIADEPDKNLLLSPEEISFLSTSLRRSQVTRTLRALARGQRRTRP